MHTYIIEREYTVSSSPDVHKSYVQSIGEGKKFVEVALEGFEHFVKGFALYIVYREYS